MYDCQVAEDSASFKKLVCRFTIRALILGTGIWCILYHGYKRHDPIKVQFVFTVTTQTVLSETLQAA